ncbi:MAG: transposase [Candidatus Brocadiales bacterium]|nr:transposase [Candidatus Brocadiales bacterium]
MMNILALLQCIQPAVSATEAKRLSRIAIAMIAMTGRVTMLGLSRWAGQGGSYRTIQRFFNAVIPWTLIFKLFFEAHLNKKEEEHFMIGDECVITKSGKETHGLDHFFSGLLNKVVKGIAIFTLAVVNVNDRRSYPLSVEQVVRSEAEKEAAKTKKKAKAKKDTNASKKKLGRPKGSKNRDKTQVELTPELLRIQKMIKKQLILLKNLVTVQHIALDGHFGNNNTLQMVLQCDLHLISKLRCDSALYFVYDGPQKSRGPRKKYGEKIDYQNIPEIYLVEKRTEDGIETCIYHAQMLHREFAQVLNVVIITKTNPKTGSFANVNLFSSDLELPHEKIIDYYSLRFQIEFNFRDAKQHWGLEDFMNVKELPLTNAINLSLFMVNLSQVLLRDFRETNSASGILDLKAYFRAAKYFEETIKMLPQKPEPVLFDQIFGHIASFGCIHPVNLHVSSP